jgi:thymidylate kinase
MLVTFEGLDGAGKSSLMRAVETGLRSRLRTHILDLADISRSPTGYRLAEVFDADELFGPEPSARYSTDTLVPRTIQAIS